MVMVWWFGGCLVAVVVANHWWPAVGQPLVANHWWRSTGGQPLVVNHWWSASGGQICKKAIKNYKGKIHF